MHDPLRRRRPTLAALILVLGLALPGAASAAVPAATPSVYNSTPDCPVSAASPVCGWNVPADSDNVFSALDYGQCPYWAAEKYPALVSDALAADPLELNWNGGQWLANTEGEGVGSSSTPAPGDLAVWQPENTDPSGHVAYVEAVVDGGIIVSQMDGASAAPMPAMQGSTQYISDAALAYFTQAYGLQYIVTGDTPTTPLAYLEAPEPAAVPTTTLTVVTTTVPVVTTPATPTAPTARRRVTAAKPTVKAKPVARKKAAVKKKPVIRKKTVKRATASHHPTATTKTKTKATTKSRSTRR
jgi:surface antigen